MTIDERRRQLIDLGLTLFTTRAYDDISIDDIAAIAGISKGLLYHYFRSKRDYYIATLRLAVDEVRGATEPDLSLPPLERLHASVSAFLSMVEQRAPLYVAVLRGGIGSDVAVRSLVDQLRDTVVSWVVDGLEIETPSPLLNVALYGWVSFLEEVCLNWIERRDVPRDQVLALLQLTLGSVLLRVQQVSPDPRLDPRKLTLIPEMQPVG